MKAFSELPIYKQVLVGSVFCLIFTAMEFGIGTLSGGEVDAQAEEIKILTAQDAVKDAAIAWLQACDANCRASLTKLQEAQKAADAQIAASCKLVPTLKECPKQ